MPTSDCVLVTYVSQYVTGIPVGASVYPVTHSYLTHPYVTSTLVGTLNPYPNFYQPPEKE